MSSATGSVVLDLDVLEHLVGEAELLGQEIHDLVVVLRLEDRLDDLLAPLERAVRRGARARASRTGCRSAADRCRSCARASAAQVVGCGSATTSSSSFSMPLGGFRHAGDGVAAVARTRSWPSGCPSASTWSFGSSAASNQRVDGMPGVFHHLSCRQSKRRSDASSRSRPPRRGTNAATRLRPGRSRAAASRYRGRDRSRPARW